MFAHHLKRTVAALALFGAAFSALAFSMGGPYDSWQVPRIGYNPLGFDMGGVMNLGEEYRWNIKTNYYAYDQSFLQYFGVQGTNAVEKAIAILNAIPPVSQMSSNLSEYPLDTRRVNYTASALNLLDVTSYTLSTLLLEMGLASPERYTWCLRSRVQLNNPLPVNYTVIKRNFDPVTLNPSSYVNGVLYTYVVQEFVAPDYADAIEVQVDPLQIGFTAVASGEAVSASIGLLAAGEYYTGLTRDDFGGWRHLYGNKLTAEFLHVETLPVGTTAGGASSIWTPVGGTNSTSTNSFVDQALRPGVDKIVFKAAPYDSLLGAFITLTNTWSDSYISNSVIQAQIVQRVLTQPDILFGAEDLGVGGDGTPIISQRTPADGWVNNDAINGATTLAGPGVINGQVILLYNKVGPYYMNQDPFMLDETRLLRAGMSWGSFAGTTNDPIVFPSGASIQELQMQAIYGGSQWTIPNSGAATNSGTVTAGGGTGN